jgi:uncharacterized circularly permuted ATP-grasp superfamily protein
VQRFGAMAPPPADDALAGYAAARGTFDEGFDADGAPHPWARATLDAVLRAGPGELVDRVRATLARAGVSFASIEGDTEFYVDPVPRVITAAEWTHVKRGVAQRVRALNAFVADVYGDQAIVADGVVPPYLIRTAAYFEPRMRGVKPPGAGWIGVAGLDVVRDERGAWMVLEDNLRTPSGFAYLHAARGALLQHLEIPPDALPRPLDAEIDLLADALHLAAPESAHGHRAPQAVVLTDGPANAAFWEHGWLAHRLDIPLVQPTDLEQRDGRLWFRPPGERQRARVDVVYRRTDADRLDSPIGELLYEPLRRGTLGLINQFGAGVADDKLTHAYADQIIRYYLGEEPVLPSVPTYDLGQPDQLAAALDELDQLVIKPRDGHGGVGVTILPHASADAVARARDAVRADPGAWIAQRLVMLSTHPTVVGGRLAARHIDLRPFVFLGEGGNPRVLPGGLTRVARDAGALVVNSSQNGGAKDTWILP